MSKFNENEEIELIIKGLNEIGYPVLNTNEFKSNILLPSNLRYKTIEWLISEFSDEGEESLLQKYNEICGECEKIDLYVTILKNFGIEFQKSNNLSDYKKAVSGVSPNSDSAKILLDLINFVKMNNYLFKSKSQNEIVFIEKELRDTQQIINYLAENKLEIFKEKIRLFPPEVKLIKKTKNEELEINTSEINNKIKEYHKVVNKLNKKLEKLQNLNLNYEIIEFDDVLQLKNRLIELEKKLDNFIKDYNQLFAKGMKYISKDKLPTLQISLDEFTTYYDVILTLSSSLEEIFSLHNQILNFNIIH